MKTAFEKIKERLAAHNLKLKSMKNMCIALSDNEVSDIENHAFNTAIKIVNEVEEEYNKDWIPVSDRLPEIEEYYNPYWVTILTKDSRKKDFYYVRKVTWNQYDKRWEEDCGKPVSDKINIIAWKEYDIPVPYKEKIGE